MEREMHREVVALMAIHMQKESELGQSATPPRCTIALSMHLHSWALYTETRETHTSAPRRALTPYSTRVCVYR